MIFLSFFSGFSCLCYELGDLLLIIKTCRIMKKMIVFLLVSFLGSVISPCNICNGERCIVNEISSNVTSLRNYYVVNYMIDVKACPPDVLRKVPDLITEIVNRLAENLYETMGYVIEIMQMTSRDTYVYVDVYFSHPDKELLAMVISSYAEGLMGEFMDKILGVDVSFIFKN